MHRLYTHLTVTTTSASDYDGLSKGVKGWLDETTNRLPALPARWSDVGGQWRSDLTPRAKQESRFNARGMRNDGGGGVRAMEAHIRPDSGHGTAGIKS